MLRNLLTSLRTPCAPWIRGMGYLDETLAMRTRALRRRTFWQPHLDNSRRFAMNAARRCRGRNRAAIIGSGLLLDVPLEELSSLFREVLLLDLVCLPEIRQEISRFGNVRFREYDATGCGEQLFSLSSPGVLPAIPAQDPEGFADADLVVSLNVMSQLWVIPRAFALKQSAGAVDEDRLDDWCGQLVRSHAAFLQSLDGSVCLIGDYEFVKRDAKGGICSRASTIWNLPLPDPDESWTWSIAPREATGEYFTRELSVGGWLLR